VAIFGAYKSDKTVLEILSRKCECLDNNQRRAVQKEIFLGFSGLGLFGLKLNKKEEMFCPFPPLHFCD